MSYKVNINGIAIEVDTIEEVRALAGLGTAPAAPAPPAAPPADAVPEKKRNGHRPAAVFHPPKPVTLPGLGIDDVPLKKIPGARVQPWAALDAARAVELAFQKHHKPVDVHKIHKFCNVPGDYDAASQRCADACRRGLIKRVAMGVYVPIDYEPDQLEGLDQRTIKAMPAMAAPLVRYMIENPQAWARENLLQATQDAGIGSTREAVKLRLWAGTRLGWIEEKNGAMQVTQSGLDAAAKLDLEKQ